MAARALKRSVVESRSGSPLSSLFLPQAAVRVFLPTSFSHRTGALQSVCCGVFIIQKVKVPLAEGNSHFLMHQKSRIRAGRAKRGGQGCARERRLILPFLAPPPPLLLSLCSCFPVFLFSSVRSLDVYLSISSPPHSLTLPRAAFAVQTFFLSFYLSSQR